MPKKPIRLKNLRVARGTVTTSLPDRVEINAPGEVSLILGAGRLPERVPVGGEVVALVQDNEVVALRHSASRAVRYGENLILEGDYLLAQGSAITAGATVGLLMTGAVSYPEWLLLPLSTVLAITLIALKPAKVEARLHAVLDAMLSRAPRLSV